MLLMLCAGAALATPDGLTPEDLESQPSAEWLLEGETPALLVASSVDTGVWLELRVVAGGTIFDWKQTAETVGSTSLPILLELPDALVTHEGVPGYPLVLNGVLRTDSQSTSIPPIHGVLDEVGRFSQIERPDSLPYRGSLYPGRPRPDATITLDDDGEDTGTYGGRQ